MPRLSHYSLTPSQIKHAIADAERDRITSDALATILARHQQGDREAASRLTRGYTWLVWLAYQRLRPSRRIDPADVLSTLMLDLATAVDRLADPDVTANDVERRIRQHLWYSVDRYAAEISPKIKSDRHDGKGTNLDRTSEHPEPVRWNADNDEPAIDLLADPQAPLPLVTPAGKPYRRPSRYDQEAPGEIVEAQEQARQATEFFQRLLPHCKTPLEVSIVQAGIESSEAFSDELHGVTKQQVKSILASLQRRAA